MVTLGSTRYPSASFASMLFFRRARGHAADIHLADQGHRNRAVRPDPVTARQILSRRTPRSRAHRPRPSAYMFLRRHRTEGWLPLRNAIIASAQIKAA
jgi:hypothetical protein